MDSCLHLFSETLLSFMCLVNHFSYPHSLCVCILLNKNHGIIKCVLNWSSLAPLRAQKLEAIA